MKAKTTTHTVRHAAAAAAASPAAANHMFNCDITVAYGGKEYSNGGKSVKNGSGGTVKSTMSRGTVTMNGQHYSEAGATLGSDVAAPCMLEKIVTPIGGKGVLASSDGWDDKAGNRRCSMRIYVPPIFTLDTTEPMSLRTSTREKHLVCFQLELREEFTDPDKSLQYMVARICEVTNYEYSVCVQLVQSHPRYAKMTKNLAAMKGTKTKYVIEVRLAALDSANGPLSTKSPPSLVLDSEDRFYYGFKYDPMDFGGTMIHLEFRDGDSEFKPLTVAQAASRLFTDPFANKPFGETTPFGTTPFGGMGGIPEDLEFVTPAKSRRPAPPDDVSMDSSISSNAVTEMHDDFASPPAAKKAREPDDIAPDDATVDFNLGGLDDAMKAKLFLNLRDQFNEKTLNNMMSRDDKKPSPKKKGRDDSGDAYSMAGASRATRGTQDREEKRKTTAASNVNVVVDDASMAPSVARSVSSKRTVITIAPTIRSRSGSSVTGSKKFK